MVGYSSGQRGQTVNLLACAFQGSNPCPTTIHEKTIPRKEPVMDMLPVGAHPGDMEYSLGGTLLNTKT